MTSSSSASSISLRSPKSADRSAVRALLEGTAVFRPEEVEVALEVFDGCVNGEGYLGLVAVREPEGPVLGLAFYGAAPMTEGTYDLYWLASDPSVYGTGVAQRLLAAVVADLRAREARLLLVETESTDAYARARSFYERNGLPEVARVEGYYRDGADKIIGAMRLSGDQ
jgi:ribosomal protein S18 acetylase RimI-like enzyme